MREHAGDITGATTGEHMLGTTIMAVTFDGGVVVGADSRTSTGSYVANRVSDKLTQLHDRIYCCRSGSAADTQAVADIVKYHLDQHSVELGDLPSVAVAAHLTRNICYQYKDQLMAGMIIGGWDKQKGGTVYSVTLGGSVVQQDYAIGGSGSTYIYGYCDAQYKKGMSKAECQKFVQCAISHAIARDGSSGGVIRLATIDKDGVTRTMVAGDELPYAAENN
uniref:Proteasome subunit beta n=1 Tax=Spongospora subterranea TaxID=70186 RepID=A0A0H5R4T7_9EUKA|eukprot:CRZ09163.1 hypothetical protein [Spongospora subterranea]